MISSEAEALAALEEVAYWAHKNAESRAFGGTTGSTAQSGRVLATRTHDGTLGLSTYVTPEEAAEKAQDMERAYRAYLRLAHMQQ